MSENDQTYFKNFVANLVNNFRFLIPKFWYYARFYLKNSFQKPTKLHLDQKF